MKHPRAGKHAVYDLPMRPFQRCSLCSVTGFSPMFKDEDCPEGGIPADLPEGCE